MEQLNDYLKYLVRFLKQKVTGFNGYVLGLSGGLDSAVVSLLTHKAIGDRLLNVIISIESKKEDAADARELIKKHGLNYREIDLTDEYHALVAKLEQGGPLTPLSKQNIKVRMRMVTLYALAQAEGKLVLGTDNAAELYTGYFTKWGDGAADLLVISSLTKGEVYEAAKILEVTPNIIAKAPSAGLFTGQTDEDEMGITYAELDAFIRGEEISEQARIKIEYLHHISEHKRRPIAQPKAYRR